MAAVVNVIGGVVSPFAKVFAGGTGRKSEIPVHPRPRRLAAWINPTGARKVHSLVDKVYQRKNLEMAWRK
jgi:hypothetical protein